MRFTLPKRTGDTDRSATFCSTTHRHLAPPAPLLVWLYSQLSCLLFRPLNRDRGQAQPCGQWHTLQHN